MKLGIVARLAALILQSSILYSIISLWLNGFFKIGVVLLGSILSAILVVLYFSLVNAVNAVREYRRDPQRGVIQFGIALVILASVYYTATRYALISESVPAVRLEHLQGDAILGVSALVVALSTLVIARDSILQLSKSLKLDMFAFRGRREKEEEEEYVDVY